MLKLIGAVLILISTTMTGFRIARRYAERPRQIRQLRQALSLLETDIAYGSRTLTEAFRWIGKREREPVASLFSSCVRYLETLDGASTYQCWKKAVEETWPHTAMGVPEREVMIDFGKTLGLSDRQDQLQHLRMAVANLKVEEDHARDEQVRYEKMCKTLGFLAGALLVAMQWRASPPVLRRLFIFAVVWYLLHELPPMKPYPEGARHMTVMAAVFAEIEEIEQWPGFIVLNELFAEQYLKAL